MLVILVLGASASGKRAYVRSLGYTQAQMSADWADDAPVLTDLHAIAMADPDGCAALLPKLMQKEVVVCNEVGSGVIPVERRAREGREAAGRLCILLAQHATRVVRLVCGIPIIIKE